MHRQLGTTSFADATLVAARARRGQRDGPGSDLDPARVVHFSYKAHLGVDAESGLIRRRC